MTQQQKIYAILHIPPPIHGASKVGEFIRNNAVINNKLDVIYSPISAAKTIEDIGRFSMSKLLSAFFHFFKISFDIFMQKPDAIYFTASPTGFAFYRDCIFAIPIKFYTRIYKKKYYLHFHAKGIKEFINKSRVNKILC